jgi:aspartyl-tRNA(Asn)/glutamyl-tRNA(Gln) amidotransferase subunit A
VVSYAHSLDTVGVFGRDVQSARTIFGTSSPGNQLVNVDVLCQHDKRDPTAISNSIRSRILTEPQRNEKLTFGIPAEYNLPSLHPTMSRAWSIAISKLHSQGHKVTRVTLPRTKEALSTYYVLATAEAASNLARYDGVRYGHHSAAEEYRTSVLNTRGEGFGEEVRRRILLGNYTLSAR